MINNKALTSNKALASKPKVARPSPGKWNSDMARQNASNAQIKSNVQTKSNVPLIEEARAQSVQERAKDDNIIAQASGKGGHPSASFLDRLRSNGVGLFFQSANTLPPWWSEQRDKALYDFWGAVDLLKGAMYAMCAKMTTIPFHIEPRDMAIQSHFREAAIFEKRIKESAEFGNGWQQFFSKQVQSLMGQDNGRFMEILDLSPNKLGPIRPPVISIAHLDPQRCIRTAEPEFPVVYRDLENHYHKLHFTRVAFEASLPSPLEEMFGVGRCAVTRAASYARNMLDITIYKEEKLGSRPNRGILLGGGGLDGEAIGVALEVVEGVNDNKGLQRFGFMPIIADPAIEEPTLELIGLSQLPDGFDEEKSTTAAMAAIALAWGVDARELWPASQGGATRADALLSHIKQRGKGPGQILVNTTRMFDNYVLPRHLKMVFDFQDDAEDRQRAEIDRQRALTRKEDIEHNVTDGRTERERMVSGGELTTAQFGNLELKDGRLPNGKPLDTLFFRVEPIYKQILTLPGIANPTDIRANSTETILNAISKQRTVGLELLANETKENASRQIRESLAALEELAEKYMLHQQIEMAQAQEDVQLQVSTNQASGRTVSTNRQGTRQGPPKNISNAANTPLNDEGNLAQENNPREFSGKHRKKHKDKRNMRSFSGAGNKEETDHVNTLKDKLFSKAASLYKLRIIVNTRALFRTENVSLFHSAMSSAINEFLSEAWIAGAEECGIAEGELTDAERQAMQEMIDISLSAIDGFASDLLAGKANGKTPNDFLWRINIWANRWNEAFDKAKVMACADQKLEWQWTPGKDHCVDCTKLNGKVKRASTWAAAGYFPRSRDLACRGYNCGCSWVQTDKPLSRGPLPGITGIGFSQMLTNIRSGQAFGFR